MNLFLVATTLILIIMLKKPRTTFILCLAYPILNYWSYIYGFLFKIGEAIVYSQDIFAASLFIYVLIAYFLQKSGTVIQKSTGLFLLFYFWGIIAIIRGVSEYGYSSIGEARWYTFLLHYYFFVIIAFKDKRSVGILLKWVIYFISAMAFWNFILFCMRFASTGILNRAEMRIGSALDSLLVAFNAVFLFLFLLLREFPVVRKTFYTSLFLFFFFYVIFVQHRSAWVGITAGFMVIFLIYYRKIPKLLIPISIIIFLSISYFFMYIGEERKSEIYESLGKSAVFIEAPDEDTTGKWRMDAWQNRVQRAMNTWIFGEGLGGYTTWQQGRKEVKGTAVHNEYVMQFSKFGIVGIFLLFSGLAYWFIEMQRYMRKEKDKYYKFLAQIIQICVFMHLVYSIFYTFTFYLWILIGSGTALVNAYSGNLNDAQENFYP